MLTDDRAAARDPGVLAVHPGALRQAAAEVAAQVGAVESELAAMDRAVAAVTGLPLLAAGVTSDTWSSLRSALTGQRDRIAGLGAQLEQAAERLGGLDR
jgi:hypothetical protein